MSGALRRERVIQTRYKLICDGCGVTIYPKDVSAIEETTMTALGCADRLFFHFHDQLCKDTWTNNHLHVLTGAIIVGMSDGS